MFIQYKKTTKAYPLSLVTVAQTRAERQAGICAAARQQVDAMAERAIDELPARYSVYGLNIESPTLEYAEECPSRFASLATQEEGRNPNTYTLMIRFRVDTDTLLPQIEPT